MDQTDGATYIVIQEGGASDERYVHAIDSIEAANEFRVDCARGAYRTSEPIEVPAELAAHGELLYTLLEDVLTAPLEYAECDEDLE